VIIGTGIDIVEVERLKEAINKWGDSFLKKVFTDSEIDYARKKRFSFEHLAARFAAKEAVLKAFGDNRWVDWKNIETFNRETGKPGVRLYGYIEEMRKQRGIDEVVVSISHTKNYALANVILTKHEASQEEKKVA